MHQDANWNVIGVTDMGGNLVERTKYTAYGWYRIDKYTGFGDRDGDGDVDSTDKGTVGTTCTGTVSGSCRILDLDFDGDYDAADATLFDALPQGLAYEPGMTSTGIDQPFAHQGLLYEPEISSYQNRALQYNPRLGRFLQRDPIGISGGVNAYEYVGSSPMAYADPMGEAIVAIGLAVVALYAAWNSSGCVDGHKFWSPPYRAYIGNTCYHAVNEYVCHNGWFTSGGLVDLIGTVFDINFCSSWYSASRFATHARWHGGTRHERMEPGSLPAGSNTPVPRNLGRPNP